MNAQTKFIVWDWNGTLLDDTHLVLTCINIVLAQVGRGPMNLDDMRALQTRPLESFYRKAGLADDEIEIVMDAERGIFHDNYEPLADQAPLRDGASDVLDHCRRCDLHGFILSNHLTDPIIVQLERRAIRHHFREVLAYACRETQFKDMTKGERLRRFIGEQKLNPDNAVIVGDTPEEIEIARALGLISVAITGGIASESRLRDTKPDHLIHTLRDLAPILQERGFAS